jgi:hypothetical protein
LKQKKTEETLVEPKVQILQDNKNQVSQTARIALWLLYIGAENLQECLAS